MAMETRLYRKAFLASSFAFIGMALTVFYSCAAQIKNRSEKDTYAILNLALSTITSWEKKDSVFISSGIIHPEYFEAHATPQNLNIFTPQELTHLKKQTGVSFEINLQKIIPNHRIYKYKNPPKKINDKPSVALAREIAANFSRTVYSICKPLYTSDGQYGLVFVQATYSGAWVWVYKKEKKKWSFYRQFWLFVE